MIPKALACTLVFVTLMTTAAALAKALPARRSTHLRRPTLRLKQRHSVPPPTAEPRHNNAGGIVA